MATHHVNHKFYLNEFLEEVHAFGHRHTVLQWCVTIIFYIFTWFQLISSILLKHAYTEGKMDHFTEVMFIITFSPENPIDEELLLPLYIIISLFLALFFSFIILCSHSARKFTAFNTIFSSIWYYGILLSFYFIFNVTVRSALLKKETGVPAVQVVALTFHLCFILIISAGGVLTSMYHRTIVSPFAARGPSNAILVSFYYIEIATCASPFIADKFEFMVIRCIVSVIFIFVGLICIPYYSVFQNFLFLMTTFFDFLICIGSFISATVFFQTVPSICTALLLSVIVCFVIWPFIITRSKSQKRLLFLYMFNKNDSVKKYVSMCDLHSFTNNTAKSIIVIAYETNHERIEELLNDFSQMLSTTDDDYFYWAAKHELLDRQGIFPDEYSEFINTMLEHIDSQTKIFWRQAWLSNVNILSKIAADIGRSRIRLATAIGDFKLRFPNSYVTGNDEMLALSEEIQEKGYSCFHITFFDIITIFIFASFTISSVFIGLQSGNLNDSIECALKIRNFTSQFYFHFGTSELLSLAQDSFNQLVNESKTNPNLNIILSLKYNNSIDVKDYFSEVLTFENISNMEIDQLFLTFEILDCLLNETYSQIELVTKPQNEVYIIGGIIVSIAFPLIIIVGIFIHIAILTKARSKVTKAFLTVPLQRFCELAGYQMTLNTFDMAPIKQKDVVMRSFSSTVFYYSMHLAFSVVASIILLLHLSGFAISVGDIKTMTTGVSQVTRVPLWSRLAITSSEDSITQYGLSRVDYVFDFLAHDSTLGVFRECIPNSTHNMIGRLMIYSLRPSPEDIEALINATDANLGSLMSGRYKYRRYVYSRAVMVMITTSVAFATALCFARSLSHVVKHEDEECLRLFEIAVGPFKEQSPLLIDELDRVSLDLEDFDFVMFVVSPNGKVAFSTRTAQAMVPKGGDISSSSLPAGVVMEITRNLGELDSRYLPGPRSVAGTDPGRSFVLTPVYDFMRGRMQLHHVVCLEVPESSTAEADTRSRLDRLFHSIYPPYIPLTQEFPITLPSKLKNDIVVSIHLGGFQRWAVAADPSVVQRFRREVSRVFNDGCRGDQNFARMYEFAAVLFAKLDRECSKVSVWHIHEEAADFAEGVVEGIKKVCGNFDAPVEPTTVLYRCKEPDVVFTDGPMELPDYGSEMLMFVMQSLPYAEPAAINYITTRMEMQLPRTAKLRTCYTPSGSKFDVYIIV